MPCLVVWPHQNSANSTSFSGCSVLSISCQSMTSSYWLSLSLGAGFKVEGMCSLELCVLWSNESWPVLSMMVIIQLDRKLKKLIACVGIVWLSMHGGFGPRERRRSIPSNQLRWLIYFPNQDSWTYINRARVCQIRATKHTRRKFWPSYKIIINSSVACSLGYSELDSGYNLYRFHFLPFWVFGKHSKSSKSRSLSWYRVDVEL